MNPETNDCECRSRCAYAAAVLGAFMIVAALVWAMRHYTTPEPLNANRGAERAKALVELRAAEADALKNPGWVDQNKGIVRLPIADAMTMVGEQWQNASVVRSNLTARAEKAMPAPPPPAPPKPSAFE
jgi:hypothetical protein